MATLPDKRNGTQVREIVYDPAHSQSVPSPGSDETSPWPCRRGLRLLRLRSADARSGLQHHHSGLGIA
jgi:hypothetical protein